MELAQLFDELFKSLDQDPRPADKAFAPYWISHGVFLGMTFAASIIEAEGDNDQDTRRAITKLNQIVDGYLDLLRSKQPN